MNNAMIIGNLTKDPELKQTATGIPYCRLTLAVNRKYKGADREKQTDYFNVVTWRAVAENCAKYLRKGKKLFVRGELQFRQYDDKDGIKRTAAEISAEEVEFLSPADESKGNPYTPSTVQKTPVYEDDPDLPF